MISLDLATDLAGARRFLETVRIFSLAESLGGVESLIEHPAIMTHATIPLETRRQLGIGDALVRLSVGVEDVEDLRADLLRFLRDQEAATGVVPSDRTVVVERFRDEIGDWRVVILTPFGARVHAPWALALGARLRESLGIEVHSLWSDDGIALHLPDSDAREPGPPAATEPVLRPAHPGPTPRLLLEGTRPVRHRVRPAGVHSRHVLGRQAGQADGRAKGLVDGRVSRWMKAACSQKRRQRGKRVGLRRVGVFRGGRDGPAPEPIDRPPDFARRG